MKIPEGWPTEEMIRAALDNLPNVNREDVVFALKAALAAAPTPPAQEEIGHSNLFEWCSPGDSQEPKWLLFFDDADRGYCYFTDEAEAIRRFNDAEALGWNCHLFALMPRTPAQEAEPVARVRKMINSSFIESTGCKGYWGDLPDGTPLYTRPINDKLRQAAAEALSLLEESSFTPERYAAVKNLRAELEKKS